MRSTVQLGSGGGGGGCRLEGARQQMGLKKPPAPDIEQRLGVGMILRWQIIFCIIINVL